MSSMTDQPEMSGAKPGAKRKREAESPTVAPEDYEYTPLPGHGWVRLIRLLAGKEQEEIECELITTSMDEADDTYEAISYVWGDNKNRVNISCNKRKLSIGVNLADALRRFRQQTKPRLLWADAVSINQADDTERGHQVKRMGRVYEKARRVIVWLGHDTEGIAKDSFELIIETNSCMDKLMGKSKHVDCWRHCCIPRLEPPYPICSDKSKWAQVYKIMTLQWFKRLWVIQEAALAKECVLHLGQETIDIAEIMELASWNSYRVDIRGVVGGINLGSLGDMFDVQCTYQNSKTWRKSMPLIRALQKKPWVKSFVDLLALARFSTASDPRDRVYAFLGNKLALNPDGSLFVEPDYDKPWNEVFYATACALLQYPREMVWVLCRVNHTSKDSVLGQDVPSWVPRWDNDSRHFEMTSAEFWYRAGVIDEAFTPSLSAHKTLSLSALIFDRIVWTSDPIEDNNFSLSSSDWSHGVQACGKPFIDVLWDDLLNHVNVRTGLELEFGLTLSRECPNHLSTLDASMHQRDFEAYRYLVRAASDPDYKTQPIVPSDFGQADPHRFLDKAENCHGGRLVVTKGGRLGIAPKFSNASDVCYVSPGLPYPILIRPKNDGKFNFVGEMYVYGVMSGDIIGEWKQGKRTLETIVLA